MKAMAAREVTCTGKIISNGRATIDHTARESLGLKKGDFVEMRIRKIAKPSGRKN